MQIRREAWQEALGHLQYTFWELLTHHLPSPPISQSNLQLKLCHICYQLYIGMNWSTRPLPYSWSSFYQSPWTGFYVVGAHCQALAFFHRMCFVDITLINLPQSIWITTVSAPVQVMQIKFFSLLMSRKSPSPWTPFRSLSFSLFHIGILSVMCEPKLTSINQVQPNKCQVQ